MASSHKALEISDLQAPVPPAGKRTGQGLRIHTMALPDVRAVQEAYIRRIIDELNDLDNFRCSFFPTGWLIPSSGDSQILLRTSGGRPPYSLARTRTESDS